jgi:integrase
MPTALRLTETEHAKALSLKVNLTDAVVGRMAPPTTGDRRYVYDTRVQGLCVAITSAGARSFYWYGRVRGQHQPRRIRLGAFPALSVADAREAARIHVGAIAKGGDPARDKALERSGAVKLEVVFARFLDEWARPRKRTWKEDAAKFETHLADWARRPIGSITRADAKALHAKIGRTAPGAANRTMALVSKLWRWAADDFGVENVAAGVERFPEHQRARFLQADELPRFFDALKTAGEPWGDFFALALLTGLRRSNLLGLRWEWVNLERATIDVPADQFKTGRPMTAVLAPEAVTILRRRHAARVPECPWVFPGRGRLGHVMEYQKPWRAIVAAAGLKDLRPHDLRRTLGSWQAAAGVSLPIIGKSLGHARTESTQIYARLTLDPVRQAVAGATAAMMKASRVKPRKGKTAT